MKKSTRFAFVAMMSLAAFSATAVENNGATLTFDPAEGSTLKEFPETITITVDGPASVKKNIAVGNPIILTLPDGTTSQMQGAFSGNTVTLTALKTLDRTQKGDYQVQLKKNGITYSWADATSSKCDEYIFTYTIEGESTEDPDTPVDEDVKFDIVLNSTVPNITTKPLEVDMRTLQTLQMYFSGANLNVTSDATATISGPSYSYTVSLAYNMGSMDGKQTNIKAMFPSDPVYNGEYTLTIPQGVIGDAVYLADHNKGHANAAVDLKFTVTGGKDQSEMTEDLSFNPSVTPGPTTKRTELNEVVLTFPSKVYYDESTILKVGVKYDQQAMGFSNYGTATLTRLSDTEVKVNFEPLPEAGRMAEYCLTLPKGTFWSEEHEADAQKGALNSDQQLTWYIVVSSVTMDVISTEPKTNTHVGIIPVGYRVSVNTTDNARVAGISLTVNYYDPASETEGTTLLLSGSSDKKDENGVIYWENETKDYLLELGFIYDIDYTLTDVEGKELWTGTISIIGNGDTGVSLVGSEAGEKVVYDLLGRRVDNASVTPGLYIINGKKVIVK